MIRPVAIAATAAALAAVTFTSAPPAEAVSFRGHVVIDRDQNGTGDHARRAGRAIRVGEITTDRKVARALFTVPLTARARAAARSGGRVVVVVRVASKSHMSGNRLAFEAWPGRTTTASARRDYSRSAARSGVVTKTATKVRVNVTSAAARATGKSLVLRVRLAKKPPKDGRRTYVRISASGSLRPKVRITSPALTPNPMEVEVVDLVNKVRARGYTCTDGARFAPAPALTYNTKIAAAARAYSHWMADSAVFTHTGSGGSNVGQRLTAAGYRTRGWGENIAAGNSTAAATVDQWLNSPGPCHNLLDPSFTKTGVGYAHATSSPYRYYWTHDFGIPAR